MQGESVVYLGRIVPKQGFRTFVYSRSGEKRLVESWDEFSRAMSSGIWMAQPNSAEIEISDELSIPKKRGRKKK